MSNGKQIGLYLFVAGIVILILYGIYRFLIEVNPIEIDAVISIGIGIVIIGLIVLFISILIEQQEDKKKMKKEIKKEDLEP
jgi:hypothetical protein